MRVWRLTYSRTMGSETNILSGLEKFFSISSRKSISISSCLAWIPQFLVRRRSSDAFVTRMIGGYDSLRKRRLRVKAAKPIMQTMYSVQRQPRSDMTMKPPMKGAMSGPVKTMREKIVIAMPRVLLLNMSEKTAATHCACVSIAGVISLNR
jgi:hypothetical protein